MTNYPAGVTDRHIDALWMDEEQERTAASIEAWLAADTAWWRRYLKADSQTRRRSLLAAREDMVGLPAGSADRLEVMDQAEDTRWWEIRSARTRARLNVERGR